MAQKNKNNDTNLEVLCNLVELEGFSRLDNELKDKVFEGFKNALLDEAKKSTGTMGKLFGTHSENIVLYITFIIAVLLILVGLIYIFFPPEYKETTNLEFWKIIVPIITGALGYIFGSGSKK